MTNERIYHMSFANIYPLYATIAGASISQQTINGHSVAVATYEITDGGELDMDGEVNGSIEDPAGIASSVVGAPNTGLGKDFAR